MPRARSLVILGGKDGKRGLTRGDELSRLQGRLHFVKLKAREKNEVGIDAPGVPPFLWNLSYTTSMVF